MKNFNLLPLTAVPENIKQNMALRQTTETQIRVAGVEKRKPIPVQYNRLRDLLDRLRSSHEEHHAFFAQVDQIVKNRCEVETINEWLLDLFTLTSMSRVPLPPPLTGARSI